MSTAEQAHQGEVPLIAPHSGEKPIGKLDGTFAVYNGQAMREQEERPDKGVIISKGNGRIVVRMVPKDAVDEVEALNEIIGTTVLNAVAAWRAKKGQALVAKAS